MIPGKYFGFRMVDFGFNREDAEGNVISNRYSVISYPCQRLLKSVVGIINFSIVLYCAYCGSN